MRPCTCLPVHSSPIFGACCSPQAPKLRVLLVSPAPDLPFPLPAAVRGCPALRSLTVFDAPADLSDDSLTGAVRCPARRPWLWLRRFAAHPLFR